MEFLRTWGPDFDQKGGGRGEGGGGDGWGRSVCAIILYLQVGTPAAMWAFYALTIKKNQVLIL